MKKDVLLALSVISYLTIGVVLNFAHITIGSEVITNPILITFAGPAFVIVAGVLVIVSGVLAIAAGALLAAPLILFYLGTNQK